MAVLREDFDPEALRNAAQALLKDHPDGLRRVDAGEVPGLFGDLAKRLKLRVLVAGAEQMGESPSHSIRIEEVGGVFMRGIVVIPLGEDEPRIVRRGYLKWKAGIYVYEVTL